jgi:hypothetical protein
MKIALDNVVVETPTAEIKDDGKVQIGFTSPMFPASRKPPATVADDGKVQIGFTSPMFPPVR